MRQYQEVGHWTNTCKNQKYKNKTTNIPILYSLPVTTNLIGRGK